MIVDTKMGTSRSGIRVARRTRRSHTPKYKQDIVRQCREPGVSVAATALAHGLNANLVRKWMQQRPVVASAVLLPVSLSSAAPTRAQSAEVSPPGRHSPDGSIDIELGGGRIRVHGAVDVEALRCVLAVLRQR